jgi:hypothetical protein
MPHRFTLLASQLIGSQDQQLAPSGHGAVTGRFFVAAAQPSAPGSIPFPDVTVRISNFS